MLFAEDTSPSPTFQWLAVISPLILAITAVVWMLRDWLKERTRIMAAQAQAVEYENEKRKAERDRVEATRLLKEGTIDTRIALSEIKQQGSVAIDQNKTIIRQTNGINEGLSKQIEELHREVKQAKTENNDDSGRTPRNP